MTQITMDDEKMINHAIWPKPFITGEIDYPNTNDGKLAAIADALAAWGNCHMGENMPENFGKAMALISDF